MPTIDTPIAVFGVIVIALLAGFGWAIGAWAWARLCAAVGW